jgi:hypothetical protein
VTDDSWISAALAANPSTPTDLLLAMARADDLDIGVALCRRRPYHRMPAEVAEVLATSSHAAVRAELVSRPETPLRLVSRLASDPARSVRWRVAMRREEVMGTLDVYVPEEAYAALARDPEPLVRQEILHSIDVPDHIKLLLTEDPELRDVVHLLYGSPDQAQAAFNRLLASADPRDRNRAIKVRGETAPPQIVAVALADPLTRESAALHCPVTRDQALGLIGDSDPTIRKAAAGNPAVPEDLVRMLANDPDDDVRYALAYRPHIPVDLLDAIAPPIASNQRTASVDWLYRERDNVDLITTYARSRSVIHRRTATNCPTLPADVIEALARDEDFGVRLMLAECHPDEVPVDLLIELVFAWRGRSGYDLVRNPRLPDTTIEQLVRSAEVNDRWRAAVSGRLTGEQRAVLAADPDPDLAAYVNPPPPPTAEELVAALDSDSAAKREWAARQPNLPIDVLWQLWARVTRRQATGGKPSPGSVERLP